MRLTKEHLEELYIKMSLTEMASHLDMARSTLYYHMKKLGVERRSKSEAQQKHLKESTHQREGKTHSRKTKEKISEGARRFWDSSEGQDQKNKLGEARRKEWRGSTSKERSSVLRKLQSGKRPLPGELSRFGKRLAEFLSETEDVTTGIALTPGHVSDIILRERKVVIELLLPISVYGNEQEIKTEKRYSKFTEQLNDTGYRVVVIEDKSNTVSRARCSRVYDELIKFFQDDSLQNMKIVS